MMHLISRLSGVLVGGNSPFLRMWDLESEKCTHTFKSGSKKSVTARKSQHSTDCHVRLNLTRYSYLVRHTDVSAHASAALGGVSARL
jgi:hypothetical protein